jgi:WS/DGAT/MGAT family acyltransferase
LWDLATQLAAEPFDRARPLWRFTVIDGLEGGRSAMVQQLHHTITDGQGGVRMSAEFLDVERDAPEPDPVPVPDAEPGPDGLGAVGVATAGHLLRRGTGIAERAVTDVATLLRHPDRLPRLGAEVLDAARSLARQVVVTDPARSPLWVDRTLRRRLEVLRVPLDDVKRSAKALGGSVNDLFVSAVAGGAGAYHRDRGVEVEELRMAMPVSTREAKTVGGNAFAPTRTLVPVGPDPIARFEAIRDRLSTTKTEPALRLAGGLAGFANLAPTSLLVRATRGQVQSIDFTTSNVRGAPFDLYVAGARIDANFPLGPLAGTAFNATLLSVAGSLDIGIHVDAGAVADAESLRDAIDASFAELLALG